MGKKKHLLLFSYITSIIIVISLDLTKKVMNQRYLLLFQTQRGKLIDFINKEIIVNYSKHRNDEYIFSPNCNVLFFFNQHCKFYSRTKQSRVQYKFKD